MKNTASRTGTAVAVCLALLTATFIGCSEPITTYQVSQQCLTGTESVLVLPFMDTRTFVNPNDPHKDDLGEHARDIFVTAMRKDRAGPEATILTPVMEKQERSLTNAEIAEYGRMYGADVVVAGQVFSFTETRAASIPPRAGMFVRLVSSQDASILFVGDHYQSAAVPGASGGRDLQARAVSDRLVQGICSAIPATATALGRIASGSALASIASGEDESSDDAGIDAPDIAFTPLPLPNADPGAATTTPLNPDEWDSQIAPELPPMVTDDLFMAAVPLPPPSLDEVGMTEEEYAEVMTEQETPAAMEPEAPSLAATEEAVMDNAELAVAKDVVEEELDVAAENADMEMAAVPDQEDEDFYRRWINSGYPYSSPDPVDVGDLAQRSGDEMAADLFASENVLLEESLAYRVQTSVVEEAEVLAAEQAVQAYPVYDAPALTSKPFVSPMPEMDGPVISMPLAVEQPRAYRTVNLVLPNNPAPTTTSQTPELALLPRYLDSGALRVLLLPYHDRENPNNLIPNTGGAEVVTTLYGTQLSQDPGIQVLWDASGQASHHRLMDKEEVIQMGKMVNADYVVRGQVVEFRRAQSVPSFYSAVISTAVLAAQIFFAEMSGVDVATEVYRVSDGACVMSRRDRAQQKYVVQAEKTVRKLATGMATSVAKVIKQPDPEIMDPLIDDITPVNLLGNINVG